MTLKPQLPCCLSLSSAHPSLGLEDLPRLFLPILLYFWSYIWKLKFSNRIWVVHLHVKVSPKDFINWHVIILSDRENNTKKLNPKFLDGSFVKSENPMFLKFQFVFYLLSKYWFCFYYCPKSPLSLSSHETAQNNMSHLERDDSKKHALKSCGCIMDSLRLWLVERNLENLYYWDLKSGENFILGFSTYIVLSKISNSMGKLWVKNELHFLLTDLGHLNSLGFCLFDYKVEIITVAPKGW